MTGRVHEESLRLLQRVGVFAGLECGPAVICPKDPIDRTMMAVWVIRARVYVLLADQESGRAEWEPHTLGWRTSLANGACRVDSLTWGVSQRCCGRMPVGSIPRESQPAAEPTRCDTVLALR